MHNYPLVYALILNYQSLDDTLQCVDSLREANYPALRILVLDNASPENEGSILKQKLAKDEFFQLPKNIGYAGGNNLGINIALQNNADYIFIVNPDIRVPPNGIENYVNVMKNNQNIFALNPIQLTEDLSIDNKFSNEMFIQNSYEIPKIIPTGGRIWEVKTLFGAAFFISRNAILRNGGFDPLFFAYWEEVDLCRRFRLNGGKLVVTEQSPVIHLRTKEKLSRHDDLVLFLRLKGMYLYRLKNPELNFINVLSEITCECFKYLRYDFKGMFAWKKMHFLKAICWIYFHLPIILFHRFLEKRRCYLYLPPIK